MTMTNRQAQAQAYLIIGLGQTGLSCARALVKKGHPVAIMDTRDEPPGLATIQAELPEVLVQTGGLLRDWMLQSDVIVLSPGIDPRLPEIKAAREHGIEIIGDIELFTRYVREPVIAITGSNGKSTVTTMVAEMAVMAGKKIQVGGNLGTPALDLITESAPDFYILELSSFQLETVESLNAYAAVVLNITPDHLDRYDSPVHYQQAKAKIYAGTGVMVINRDDPLVSTWGKQDRDQIGFTIQKPNENEFGLVEQEGETYLALGQQTLINVEALQIAGEHNIANALAALALGHAMKLPMPAMIEAVSEYRGLPHRCQLIRTRNDVRWVNDSKATNVGACVAAIEGLAKRKNVILIAGGVAKDQDFSELTSVLSGYVKSIVMIGIDADKIACVVPGNVTQYQAASLKEAVEIAERDANKGDWVLLSPACASFDMFASYSDRGEKFMTEVEALI